MVTVQILGDKELDKALMKLDKSLRRKTLQGGMRKASKLVKAEAKRLAPSRTGALRKSIKVRAGKRSRRTFGIDIRIGQKDWTGETWYGNVIEGGRKDTMKRSVRKSEGSNGQGGFEGYHFMRDAGNNKAVEAKKLIFADVENTLKELKLL